MKMIERHVDEIVWIMRAIIFSRIPHASGENGI